MAGDRAQSSQSEPAHARLSLPVATWMLLPAPSCCAGMPRRDERASSPGRALQEVKSKLNQFTANVARVQPGTEPNAVVFAAPSEPAGAEDGTDVDDASAEIADIDSRLQALQSFLKAAKAGTPV